MKKAIFLFMVLVWGMALPASAGAPANQTVGAVNIYTFKVETRELSALEADWNAWVFETAGTLRAFYVNARGEQIDFTLPTQVSSGEPVNNLAAVSDSGTLLVYAMLDPAKTTLSVHAYDLTGGLVSVAEISAPDGAQFANWGFSADVGDRAETVGFGVAYFKEGQMPMGFDFYVWSLPANTMTYSVSSKTPAMAQSYDFDPGERFFPMGVHLGASWMEFGLVPWGTDAFGGESFVWVMDTGAIYRGGTGGRRGGDRLPVTGEHAFVSYDDAYVSCRCQPMLEFNVINVYDPSARREVTVYNEMVVSLSHRVRWFEDGERLAFVLPDEVDSKLLNIHALDRSGGAAKLGSFRSDGRYSLLGVSNGVLVALYRGEALELHHFDGAASGGEPRLMWQVPVREQATVEVVWATAPRPPGFLAAFPEAEPVHLAVGGRAMVNSTEGDPVNVRAGVGTSHDVVAQLRDGDRVEIIGGPETDDTDNYTWWQVRIAAGQSGWVAEVIWTEMAGVRLLVPLRD